MVGIPNPSVLSVKDTLTTVHFIAHPLPQVNRHCFDAVPDPTFHFDADLVPDPDPTPCFTHVGKPKKILLVPVYIVFFYLYRQCHQCHNYQYFGQNIEIFSEKIIV